MRKFDLGTRVVILKGLGIGDMGTVVGYTKDNFIKVYLDEPIETSDHRKLNILTFGENGIKAEKAISAKAETVVLESAYSNREIYLTINASQASLLNYLECNNLLDTTVNWGVEEPKFENLA